MDSREKSSKQESSSWKSIQAQVQTLAVKAQQVKAEKGTSTTK